MRNLILIMLVLLTSDVGSIAQSNIEIDKTVELETSKEVIVDTTMYDKPDPGNQKLKAAALEVKIIKLQAFKTKNKTMELREIIESDFEIIDTLKKQCKNNN